MLASTMLRRNSQRHALFLDLIRSQHIAAFIACTKFDHGQSECSLTSTSRFESFIRSHPCPVGVMILSNRLGLVKSHGVLCLVPCSLTITTFLSILHRWVRWQRPCTILPRHIARLASVHRARNQTSIPASMQHSRSRNPTLSFSGSRRSCTTREGYSRMGRKTI